MLSYFCAQHHQNPAVTSVPSGQLYYIHVPLRSWTASNYAAGRLNSVHYTYTFSNTSTRSLSLETVGAK